MTIAERNDKLKHFITCLKCEVNGKHCDVNCSTQYDAGNMGEIIENLEAISKALEQGPCEDCIDRSKLGLTDFEIIMCDGDYKEALKMLLDKIEKAPSVYQTASFINKPCISEGVCHDIAVQKMIECEDTISREAVHDLMATWLSDYLLDETREALEVIDAKVEDLPSVTPLLTEEQIQKMQELEQAEVQKAYELGKAEQPKTGHWIDIMVGDMPAQACDRCNTFYPLAYTGGGHKYCPNCGAKMESELDNQPTIQAVPIGVLDKIRAEIENDWQLKKYPSSPFSCGLRRAIEIIDKYKA